MAKSLYLKKVFENIYIFSIKMSESKILFRLMEATITYKHISRNIGATLKASRKLAEVYDERFLYEKVFVLKNLLLQKQLYLL